MVKVVVCGVAGELLFNVPEIVLPVPLAGIPVTLVVLSRTHEKVVPAMLFGLVMLIVNDEPGQMVCDAGVAATSGIKFTVKLPEVLV